MKYVVLFCCVFVVAFAGLTKKSRVAEQKVLSDEEPGSKEFDHEAFLGEEQAREFDSLSPEESKRRLGIIADRLDSNKDGKVDTDELKEWILHAQNRYVLEDAERQMKDTDENKNSYLEWDEYYTATYGHITEEDRKEDEGNDFMYRNMIARDEKRWKAADENGDNALTLKELQAFLHPEEYPHMKDVVLEETVVDIDKDKDGVISLDEYIGDMYNDDEEEEPQWVKTEREQFSIHRDKDGDGKLNKEEVRGWIFPDDYEPIDAEAKHLIYECDSDKDGFLSKEEILEHHDQFVGSQITNWGDDLQRHDEF